MNKEYTVEEYIHEADIESSYDLAIKCDKDIERRLEKIKQHYLSGKFCFRDKCKSLAEQLLLKILTDSELEEIHSARYRVKDIHSIWGKYIKKKALLPEKPGTDYNIEKYRLMDEKNYYKILTDLIGIRILIRYQQQWEIVHEWIWSNFHKPNKEYIKNWLDDYPIDGEEFIVEKPKLYLRSQADLPLYQKFGKDVFEVHSSEAGYNSIHYVIWYDGKYVEIQVRSIYDEAWGECTHDLVYKCKKKALKLELDNLSKCLAIQTQSAEMIADLMFEKSKQPRKVARDETTLKNTEFGKKFEKLEQQLQKISKKQKSNVEFDGDIDSLI